MKKAYKTIMSVLTVMTVAAGAVVNTAPLSSDRYSVAAVAESEVVRGQFEGGASYRFIPGTGALILEGEGTFTAAEFEKTAEAYGAKFAVLDRKVKLPANTAVLPYNEWLYSVTQKGAAYPVCAYAGSPSWIKYQEMINYLAADAAARGEGKSRKDFMDEFVLTTLSDKSGFFDSGVTYCYNEETGGLIFDGKGELSSEEFVTANRSFNSCDFMFFGKDVKLGYHKGTDISLAVRLTETVETVYGFEDRPVVPVFTYAGTDFAKKFETMTEKRSAKEGDYVYYTVEDDVDPYTFVNPLEPVPEYVHRSGHIEREDVGKTPIWIFEGSVEAGVLEIIIPKYSNAYTLEDLLEAVKNYNVVEVYLGGNTNILPQELQEFETIEEAEAYLLKLINDGKKTDDSNRDEDDVKEETTESETAVQTETAAAEATLRGDADMNGALGISDAIAISKFNLNNKLYPLSDRIAVANADMNGDGIVDALDCSLLIEANLGN